MTSRSRGKRGRNGLRFRIQWYQSFPDLAGTHIQNLDQFLTFLYERTAKFWLNFFDPKFSLTVDLPLIYMTKLPLETFYPPLEIHDMHYNARENVLISLHFLSFPNRANFIRPINFA